MCIDRLVNCYSFLSFAILYLLTQFPFPGSNDLSVLTQLIVNLDSSFWLSRWLLQRMFTCVHEHNV